MNGPSTLYHSDILVNFSDTCFTQAVLKEILIEAYTRKQLHVGWA